MAGMSNEWTFTGTTGQMVIIDAYSSSGFDTYIDLRAPNGAIEDYDDDGGEGLNSRITRSLAETGTYTIVVRGFSGRATGDYVVSLAVGTAP